jgi:uncharacterized protein (TIGR03435 family)
MTRTVFAGLFLCCSLCLADGPSFDAASIRMTGGGVQPVIESAPGTLTIRNQSLLVTIGWAYDTPLFQITAPAWVNEERFDILAKAEGGGDETKIKLMLRKLLADRFGLQVHNDEKEMQIYTMTLANGQPKFKETTEDGPPVFDRGGPTMLTAHRVTMADLAEKISEPLQRPVIDETGLKGKYEIRIDVSGYMLDQNGGGGGPPPDLMSLLFKGLQEQLGLKLSSKKESVKLLVVDKMEKTPTEN